MNRYGSLSRSFRLAQPRENIAVVYLRHSMKLNIAHIAELLGRSKATIHYHLSGKALRRIDHRGQTQVDYMNRLYSFRRAFASIQLRVKMFLTGFFDTIQEAMSATMIPEKAILDFVSENRLGEDEEDPA